MTTSLIPQEHIVSTDFDGGEGVLVDLNTKQYYQLNETAMLVWRGLAKGQSREEIIGELTNGYEVSSEHAAESVEAILRQFQSQNLVRARVDQLQVEGFSYGSESAMVWRRIRRRMRSRRAGLK